MKDYTDYLIEAYGSILTPSETIYKHSVPIELVPNSPMTPARAYSDLDYRPGKKDIRPDKCIQVNPYELDRKSVAFKLARELADQLAISKPEEKTSFYYLYRKDNPALFVTINDNEYIDSYRDEDHIGDMLEVSSSRASINRAVRFIKKELELDKLTEETEDFKSDTFEEVAEEFKDNISNCYKATVIEETENEAKIKVELEIDGNEIDCDENGDFDFQKLIDNCSADIHDLAQVITNDGIFDVEFLSEESHDYTSVESGSDPYSFYNHSYYYIDGTVDYAAILKVTKKTV